MFAPGTVVPRAVIASVYVGRNRGRARPHGPALPLRPTWRTGGGGANAL